MLKREIASDRAIFQTPIYWVSMHFLSQDARATGVPSLVAGLNFHLLTTLTAKSLKSGVERLNSLTFATEPFGATTK